MRIALDAAMFPATRRRRAWRDLLCDTYASLDSDYADDDFRSVITGHVVDDHTFTQVTSSSRHHVVRSRTSIKRDGLEVLFFGFSRSGRFVMSQAGREAVVDPGCIAFNDTTRPFRTDFGGGLDIGWFAIPKKAFEDRVGSCEDLTAVTFGPSTPIQRIAFDFLSGLGAILDSDISQTDAVVLLNQAIDLIAMTISGATSATTEAAMAALRETRLRRLKAYLDDNIHRADLTRETAAAALSMSTGQIDSLFALEAATFDRYVMERRLDGCRAYLTSGVPLRSSVEDVATLWGFVEAKEFCRAFEQRFGGLPPDLPDAPRAT